MGRGAAHCIGFDVRWPRFATENRLLALIQIGLALGGATLVTALLRSLASLPGLYLVAIFLLVAGGLAYVLYRALPAIQSGARHAPPPQQGWVSPDDLGGYLDSINKTMAEKGFGRNPNLPPEKNPQAPTPSWEELNAARNKRYQETQGLFLTHTWEPTIDSTQVADVELRLFQHGEGPLSRGEIRAVEYTLGPKFSNHSIVCTNPKDGFATQIALWGPMLCLAKVYFAGNEQPLLLERYINLDGIEGAGAPAAPTALGSHKAKVLNELIERGLELRNGIGELSDPQQTNNIGLLTEEWNKECWKRLGEEVTDLRGLYYYQEHAGFESEQIIAYLENRLVELRRILERLT